VVKIYFRTRASEMDRFRTAWTMLSGVDGIKKVWLLTLYNFASMRFFTRTLFVQCGRTFMLLVWMKWCGWKMKTCGWTLGRQVEHVTWFFFLRIFNPWSKFFFGHMRPRRTLFGQPGRCCPVWMVFKRCGC